MSRFARRGFATVGVAGVMVSQVAIRGVARDRRALACAPSGGEGGAHLLAVAVLISFLMIMRGQFGQARGFRLLDLQRG